MAKQQCEKAACPNRTYATEPERLVDTYADTILRVCYTYLRLSLIHIFIQRV